MNTALVILFLLGIYLGIDLKVAQGLPVPTVISGLAGMLLLCVNCDQIRQQELGLLALIVLLYLVSILMADDYCGRSQPGRLPTG